MDLPVRIEICEKVTTTTSVAILLVLTAILVLSNKDAVLGQLPEGEKQIGTIARINLYLEIIGTILATVLEMYIKMTSSFITLLCFPKLRVRGVSDARTALGVLLALATTYAIYNVSMQARFKTYLVILDSDLVLTSALSLGDASSSPPGMQQWENAQDSPVNNTILKTILAPEFVPVNRVCTSVVSSDSNFRLRPDFNSSVMVSSAEYVLGDLPTSGVTLPYDISTAAGLLITGTHATPLLYDPNGGVGYKNMSSSLRIFVNTARQWSAMPKGASIEVYLKASNTFLLDLNSTIALTYADLSGMKVNYSRARLDKNTCADALTLDIPYDDAVSTRSNTYELLASSGCGPTTCASQPPDFFTPEHQVQVLTRQGVRERERVFVFPREHRQPHRERPGDHVGSKFQQLDPGFLSRFDFNNSQKAFAANVRRYRTISIVKLTWGCTNWIKCFKPAVRLPVVWEYFEYVEALDQYVLLGVAHFPLLQVARFHNQTTEWKPLVITLSPSSGNREIFAEARISTSGTWAKSKSDKPVCSSEVEKLVVRQTTGHLYSGHPLQTTFMSGYFFLLQFATLRSSIAIFDTFQSTEEVDLTDAYRLGAEFDENADFYSYGLQVPEIAGLISWLTMLCVFLTLLHIVTRGPAKNKEQTVRRLNLPQCVEVMLVDKKYPSTFLKYRVVLCDNGKSVETHDIRNHTVVAATLKHNKNKGAPISLQVEDSATTEKPVRMQPVEEVPEPNVNPVELAQVETSFNPLE